MSGTTPFRGFAAPSTVARVNLSREFGHAYGLVEDAFRRSRIACASMILVVLGIFGCAAFITVPHIISHIGIHPAHAYSCFCKMTPYVVALIAAMALSVWFFVAAMEALRPFRGVFQGFKNDLAAIRRFNIDAARVNGAIREFETSTEEMKAWIVDEAMRLESLRPRVLRLAMVRHER